MNLIAMPQDGPLSYWWRGGVWRVESDTNETGDVVHHLIPEQGSLPLHEYEPIQEAPNAYLKFARLRDDLWLTADKPDFPGLCEHLAEFVTEYGLPVMAVGQIPGERILDPNMTVEVMLQEAARLAVAVRCYQALDGRWGEYQPRIAEFFQSPEGRPFLMTSHEKDRGQEESELPFRFDTRGGMTGWLEVTVNLYRKSLWGLFIAVRFHSRNGWQPTYAYNSLLTAMWFQLSQALLRDSGIRRCEECQDLFEPVRSDQRYHNASCRGKANARNTYRRKRG